MDSGSAVSRTTP